MDRIEIVVRKDERRERLEDLLFARFGGLSKMYLREIVRDGRCEVNGRHENVGYRVRPNDFLEVDVDLSRENAMRPQEMELQILFEDIHLIVVNKPPGMLVHPTHRDKNGTLLNGLAHYLNRENNAPHRDRNAGFSGSSAAERIVPAVRPGLVHRLDKQTSGLLVISKNERAHRKLADHFKRKLIEKRYVALVDGVVRDDEGTIEAPIGRFPDQKQWGIKADGKHAITNFWVRERREDRTLLELQPVTGRTNQLRIHCQAIGHPIVGDDKRGGSESSRLWLHAWKLSFQHPVSREKLSFQCDIDLEGG